MSQTQVMSAAMASELLQSIGVELTIFALTVAFAVAFRGLPSGLTKCQKAALKSSSSKGMQTQKVKAAAPWRSSSPKPIVQLTPQTSAPQNGLRQQVASIIDWANKRQSAEAIHMYEEMRARGEHTLIKDCMGNGIRQPAEVYNMLVQSAGRIGRLDLIEPFLDDMIQAGIDRSLAFYEGAMKMLASKKWYQEALAVCSRLEADGLEPSPVTLSCLIVFAVEVGDSERAIGFFKRLAITGTPSIRACMTILRVHSKRQDWPRSLAVIRDMQDSQAAIDSLVLNVVLATGVAAGQLDATKALLKEFSQIGIRDVVSYNTVLKGLAKQQEIDMALKLLDEMHQAGVTPNAITFNTVMDAAVRCSRVADAWHVLARMRDAGVSPDKFTCTTLMKSCSAGSRQAHLNQIGATSEQLIMILDLLRHVTKECDSALCSVLFRSVIEATAKVNDPALTKRAVAQMREQKVMLSSTDYQRLLHVLMGSADAKPCSTAYRPTALESMRQARVC